MGCGKARFGRNAKKTHKIENFGPKVCSLRPRDDPHMRPRGNPRWDLEATRNDRGFLALPTETSFTTPHYYPQYEVWAIEFVLAGSL